MLPINNNLKNSIYLLAAFFVPLFIAWLLFQIGIANLEYRNEILHAVLMGMIVLIDGYIVYAAYHIYDYGRHTIFLFILLAFVAAGIGHTVHSLMVSGIHGGLDLLFDFSEHFGIFLSAVLLLIGFFFSFKEETKQWLYARRNNIIYGFIALNVVGYLTLLLLSGSSEIISSLTVACTAATGAILLFLIVNLWAKYRQDPSTITFYATLGMAVLVNTAVIPFFYEEWNLLWWYWHLVLIASNALILWGVIKIDSRTEEAIGALTDIPFHSRILTRLLVLFVVVLAIGPLILSGYFSLVAFRQNLRQQMLDNLSAIAESKEGHLFSFLTSVESRAADFASDGFIRDLTTAIVQDPAASAEFVRSLNYHLRANKMPLSRSIYGINIIGFNGRVIASTNTIEIGRDERDDDYFKRTLALKYGEAVVNDAHLSHHFAVDKNTITVSSPIMDRATGKSVGIIVNYYETSELDDLLMGREQVIHGAISGTSGFHPTLDIYLVNSEGLMISESRFLGKDVFLKQKVDSLAVRGCDQNQETAGTWKNYLGADVFGVVMCSKDLRWVLVTEISQKDALEPVADFQRSLTNSILLTMILVVLLGVYLSRRISKPIESLINTTKDIIGGNFGARVPIESRDEIGELGKSFNVMLDELGKFTRTLSIERKKLETILDSLPLAVSIINEDRVIKYANWVFKKTFGGRCIGDKCFLLAKDNKKICPNCPLKADWEAKKDGMPGIIEVDGVAGGRTYSIIHSPFEDVDGRKLVIEVFRDVTKEREIDRAKSEFVSVASHQMRTPLTAINWYIEMLLSGELGKLSAQQRSYLQEVYNGSKRMGSLVNDLLNLSRIESGKIKSEPVAVRADILVQQIVEDFKPVALEKQCVLVVQKDNLEFPKINLDQNLFRQVIVNLLANAVTYSKEGQCAVTIELHLDLKNAEIVISIKDSGIGIPKDDQGRIFDKFFRAQNAIKKVTDGTGLGLYISKLIIESFNGRIWFESKENVGTTFFVALPVGGIKRLDNF